MTRKHFIKLANTMLALRPNISEEIRYETWVELVNVLADMCADENPRFDYARFKEACGVWED